MNTKRIFLVHPAQAELAMKQGKTLQPDCLIHSNNYPSSLSAQHLAEGCSAPPRLITFPCPITRWSDMAIRDYRQWEGPHNKPIIRQVRSLIKMSESDLVAEMELPEDIEQLAQMGDGYIFHLRTIYNLSVMCGWAEVATYFVMRIFESLPVGGVAAVVLDSRISRLAAWQLEGFPEDPEFDGSLESTDAYEMVQSQGMTYFCGLIPTIRSVEIEELLALSMQ